MGFAVQRYDARRDPDRVLLEFLNRYRTDLVLDIGANSGQYASSLRTLGYRGRIVSFEPLNDAFNKLKIAASGDSLWQVVNCAIGASSGHVEINVAGNSYSSSILKMMPRHAAAAPESAYVETQRVKVEPLDSLFSSLKQNASGVFLKIDTQGYTSEVLEGATASLNEIVGLQMEMSLVTLYEGEPLIGELICKVGEHGFKPILIKREFDDRTTGQQLQVDGVFFKL